MNESYLAQARTVAWLESKVIRDARGDDLIVLDEEAPADRFWLGRVASEETARAAAREERFTRLDPCAIGFTFRPSGSAPWTFSLHVSLRLWRKEKDEGTRAVYRKSEKIELDLAVSVSGTLDVHRFGEGEFRRVFREHGSSHDARIEVELMRRDELTLATLTLVNTSPKERGQDPIFYEAALELRNVDVEPIVLDDLPDSFRYNRRIPAWGVNAGVSYADRTLRTTDYIRSDRQRPTYWDPTLGEEPDLSFETLARDPIEPLRALVDEFAEWTEAHWSTEALEVLGGSRGWTPLMQSMAIAEAASARAEVDELQRGLDLLVTDGDVRRAFQAMNEAFAHSGSRKGYTGWRPFQIGFFLLALPSLVDPSDSARGRVDTLWFATGGGKTETYLALVVILCLLDRIRGKHHGISAWSRFPLRMLSLQQTQRFADALAGAELARRRHGIGGSPIALGYFVGQGTPNRIPYEDSDIRPEVDYRNPTMPARYRLLLNCPFCFRESVSTDFDEAFWRLRHKCSNDECPWPEDALPFYVVDDEIYRFLPSVVVGTIDKAALVGMSAAMRGFFGAPLGRCTADGHGFTYARRSKAPNGCLVPLCQHPVTGLPQAESTFAPGLRVQDELHLLSDSLGAIDAQYETLLDHLTRTTGAPVPKIVGSSATLAGFVSQVQTLYRRDGLAFPMPGPDARTSFWTRDTDRLMRRFVALAPRGQTQEFASDRIAQSLQEAIRRLQSEALQTCEEIGVDPAFAPELLDLYGTDVFYGSKLPDIEAVARSLESQPPAIPTNIERLTGGTDFSEVRTILDRLGPKLEPVFEERIHVICASAMMSHGVDIDRFNIMTILGVPLKASEFIQTAARIGRRYPGIIFVLHRMVYERDSKVFRSFDTFVQHGDRFVEPVAITRKSRNVLAKTMPGAFVAQLLQVEEPKRMSRGGKALTTVREVRAYERELSTFRQDMIKAMIDGAQIDRDSEPAMAADVDRFVDDAMWRFGQARDITYPPNALEPPPLRSLRDVEARIPIREAADRRGGN